MGTVKYYQLDEAAGYYLQGLTATRITDFLHTLRCPFDVYIPAGVAEGSNDSARTAEL